MKRLIMLALLGAIGSGCAHLGQPAADARIRTELWTEAQYAFWSGDFVVADATFARLARDYPRTLEGQESLFYLGALRLDPRNPNWDSAAAERRLGSYLALLEGEGPRLYRYPEARSMFELASELNRPADSRIAALQPGERTIRVEERVIVPGQEARELQAEVTRLRQQIAERDTRIREQQEELERIRRTLIGPGGR
jgi:TolA-binding protein